MCLFYFKIELKILYINVVLIFYLRMIDRENKNALFIKAVIIFLRHNIRWNVLIFDVKHGCKEAF